MIPLVKVGLPNAEILMPRLEKILYSGMIAEGDAVYEFEDRFLATFGLTCGISMSSGTSALHCALTLAGVGDGDEVITTSMTAEPTNLAILHVGATPVFADVDIDSGNISPESIREKITNKTKAIIVVHYAGIPVRLRDIIEIGKEFGLEVIEDCAHALGAKYEGNSVGSFGDYAIFSFQAIKHMTCVDGGFLIIKDNHKLQQAKKFRWFGMEKGVDRRSMNVDSVGYKYNFNNVSATIGLAQLDLIDKRISLHIDNGRYFDREIAKISGFEVPRFDLVAEPSYWLYTIFSENSDDVEKLMNGIGVSASKLHRPNHLHSLFSKGSGELVNLGKYYSKMIHIQCGWWLSVSERELIVDALKKG
jgi:perosamine synthetase